MGIGLNKEKVIEELSNNNILIKNNILKIKHIYYSYNIIVEDEFGELKTSVSRLRNNIYPSITTAINKNDYFSNKSNKIHNYKYDYSKVNYLKTHDKVIIVCKEHGEFLQSPQSHLQGRGCPKCGLNTISLKTVKTTDFFKNKANKVHSYKYNYDLVQYFKNTSKVKIICSKHGIFEQRADIHLRGFGCKKCSRLLKTDNSWKYSNWEKQGIKSKNFISYQLYIIKCWNDKEEFYKIGKTFNDINKRFDSKKKLPYNYNIEKIITGTSKEISLLEQQLKTLNKQFKYLPLISFGGRFECFKTIKYEK
jgi:hypothetical protein